MNYQEQLENVKHELKSVEWNIRVSQQYSDGKIDEELEEQRDYYNVLLQDLEEMIYQTTDEYKWNLTIKN